MVIGSKGLIRDINTALVLETIIKDAPVSRVDIAKKTGLTKGTITNIVQHLLDISLVMETTLVGHGIGRKSLMLELSPRGGFCVCVDLDQNEIRIMSADLCGQKNHLASIKNNISQNISQEIIAQIKLFLKATPNTPFGLIGISIAVHPYSSLEINFEKLTHTLKEAFNSPVFIHNYCHFAVLGENAYSTKVDNIAFVDNSNHVSMGVISGGKLFLGGDEKACAIEKMIIGERGGLNNYASLSILLNKLGPNMEYEDFFELLKGHKENAISVASEYIKYMSIALQNIIYMYNPSIIVINSPLTSKSDEIFLRLKLSLGKNKGILYRSMLKEDAVLYGGVVYCITNFLKIENFKPSRCYFKKMLFI